MKERRYWLRGGVIGIAVYVLLFVMLVVFAPDCPIYTPCPPEAPSCPTPSCPVSYIYVVTEKIGKIVFYPLYQISRTEMFLHQDTINFALPIVYCIVFGSLLGYFYGKIKNRKQIQ